MGGSGVIRIAGITLLMLSLAACGKQKEHGADSKPVPVLQGAEVSEVRTEKIPEQFEVVGTVRARTSAVVSTRVPGTISVLKVREGDRVRKGQLLVQLDAQENQANAAAAVAGIDEARRMLDDATARRKLADATFERYQKLFTEQAVSRQEFEVKQTEKEVAAQGVARAEARLKQAQQGARAAGTVADYTRIIAPVSGVITSKQADLGASVFPGQPIMTIEDGGSYNLELAIPETMAVKVKPGMAVQVTLDALNSSFTAAISEIVPSADPASRTFTAKIGLNQKGLRSGMFGRASIFQGSSVDAMLVPKKALLEKGALTSVWVVDKEKIARLRLVKVGKTIGDKVEILAGLSDGEKIAVSAAEKLSEGVRVE